MKPLDDNSIDEGKELIRMWQENSLPPPFDASQLAREIAAQVKQFDRKIFWRNFREYAAGGIFMAFMLVVMVRPEGRLLAWTGIAAAGFVMFYMWWSHRNTPQPDLSADARSYQAALLARYDHQIRLLRRVKYWYVLPLYCWMLFAASHGRAPLPMYIVMTVFALFIVWLNESYAVKKLREQREKAEKLLDRQ
jgi:hypothetical protein